MESAGFEHYEISNFARHGKRCRHNETYWANEAYFGFGVGAARYIRGRREINTRDLNAYIRKALNGESCTFQSEELDPSERSKETMAVQLRRCDGINREAFRTQTGHDLEAVAGPELPRLVEQRLLDDDGCRVRLTRDGKYVADAIIEKLM
jgi:oxygen-independent coproporphyrinogen-3 oxidase